MVEKYIIQFNFDGGDRISYWDGAGEVNDLNKASLYPTLVSVRQAGGVLQSQFTDRDVDFVKVIVTVNYAPTAVI